MSSQSVAILVFVCVIILSRVMTDQVMKSLSTEEKGRLVEELSSIHVWSLLPLLILLGLIFIVEQKVNLDPTVVAVGFVLLVVAFAVLTHIIVSKKLKALNLPSSFQWKYQMIRLITFGGVLLFYLLLFAL